RAAHRRRDNFHRDQRARLVAGGRQPGDPIGVAIRCPGIGHDGADRRGARAHRHRNRVVVVVAARADLERHAAFNPFTRRRAAMKHRRIRPIVAALISVAILASCSAEEEAPEPERAVHSVNSSLPEVEVEQLSLPFAFQELPAFTLPFEDIPRSADGILFGLHEVDGVLEFSAVSTDGEVLWTTERPASCSGFTLSKIGETPIAVLTDVESTDDALAQVTASAYDLRTGELQWGPVPVAGAWRGPGTVFAEAAPASEVGWRGSLDHRAARILLGILAFQDRRAADRRVDRRRGHGRRARASDRERLRPSHRGTPVGARPGGGGLARAGNGVRRSRSRL